MPDHPDETTRLLAPTEDDNDASSVAPKASRGRSSHTVVIYVLVLQFITVFGFYHILAPKLRLLELSICRAYYAENDPSVIVRQPSWPGYDIEERRCKISHVQRSLSQLRAWGVLLDGLCGM
jgi:hypothetical protein